MAEETIVLLIFAMEFVETTSLLCMKHVTIPIFRQMTDVPRFAEFRQAIIVSTPQCLQDATQDVVMEK